MCSDKNKNFQIYVYEVIQNNEFDLKFKFYLDDTQTELEDISNKKFYIILKEFDDYLNNNSNAKINREIELTQEEIDNSELHLILISAEMDLPIGKYKFEVFSIEDNNYETKLQATLNILESINKNE